MLPPGLSMLWEPVAPIAALHDRFGFTGIDAATDWVGRVLAEHWGVTVRACSRLVISDQNAIAWVDSDVGRLVVKWSRARSRFTGLDASTRLLHRIAVAGVPVASPLEGRESRVRVEVAGPLGPLSLAVLPEIDGDWLDVDDLAAVHSAGRTLAVLHAALRAADDGPGPGVSRSESAQHEEPAVRLGRWLVESDRGLVPEASRRLAQQLATTPRLEQARQLVHHDYRAANILVRGSAVVAVLDFDDVELAHRVDDLARASVFLATRFTGWSPTPGPSRTALREGYESVMPLSDVEGRWLEILTLWYGIAAIPAGAGREAWAAAL